MWHDLFSWFLFMFGHFSSCVFIVVHTQRLLSVFWIPSTESTWTYLDFGVAEELSDFSCIACGIYKMRCCNPTATTYQMRSLEPCIADGFAPVKKATHVSLQWLIHENPNPCRAHPAPGLQVCRTFNSLLWLWMVMACYGIPCAWNRVQVLGSANPSDIIP
jgi:hypothetical protein